MFSFAISMAEEETMEETNARARELELEREEREESFSRFSFLNLFVFRVSSAGKDSLCRFYWGKARDQNPTTRSLCD